MKRLSLLALASFALVISACAKNPVIAIPPAAPAQMFVANFGTAQVVSYAQPLSAGSTATSTITAASLVDGVAADAAGNLYVPNGNVIYVYAAPASATTIPTTVGPIPGAVNFRGLNFDPSGNLWIADAGGNQVFEFTLPLSTTPLRTVTCVCFAFPIEVNVDAAGHIFTTNNASGTVQVLNVPVATGLSALAPVASITTPTGSAIGLATDVKDRLFVTEDATSTVLIYNPPFATGNLPVGAVAPAGNLVGPAQAHFDKSGNLYVAYQSDTSVSPTGGVAVFGGPISSASVPLFTIQGAGSGMTNPVDLTFAP